MTLETRENRLKRLTMRSMRRGTKEMDILLMRFSEAHLAALTDVELDAYEALLTENDQDLYQWISGQSEGPQEHQTMLEMVRKTAAPPKR